jgi:hypothetical protein
LNAIVLKLETSNRTGIPKWIQSVQWILGSKDARVQKQ